MKKVKVYFRAVTSSVTETGEKIQPGIHLDSEGLVDHICFVLDRGLVTNNAFYEEAECEVNQYLNDDVEIDFLALSLKIQNLARKLCEQIPISKFSRSSSPRSSVPKIKKPQPVSKYSAVR